MNFELNINNNNEIQDFSIEMLNTKGLRPEFKHAVIDLMDRRVSMSTFLDRLNNLFQDAIDKSTYKIRKPRLN